jgi:hypothetical protein
MIFFNSIQEVQTPSVYDSQILSFDLHFGNDLNLDF